MQQRRGRLLPGSICLCVLATLYAASLLRPTGAQTTCGAGQQPLITAADPPSGSRQTQFTILGENLDVDGTITALQGDSNILVETTLNVSAKEIMFMLNPLPIPSSLVTFLIDPEDEGCESASVELYVLLLGTCTYVHGSCTV